jgi:hypothetical protein
MQNPYQAPAAAVAEWSMGDNTSGMGKDATIPPGVAGWSWGAFLLNWIWAVSNRTWIGLLCFIPYVGFVMSIILGVKGREWAWRNKRWDSVEHFQRVQRKWSIWSLVVVVAMIAIMFAIAIPAYQDYVVRARAAGI